MQINDTNSHLPYIQHTLTHSYTHTHSHLHWEREKQTHLCWQSSNGRHVQPNQAAERWITHGEVLLSALPCPPWQLLCYGIISLFMQQMTNAICCLHIGPALPNGNRRRTAKNGCKDMIISNHLNNLLLAAARTESPLFRVPCSVCRVHGTLWKY